jgi:hydroxymethylpyrimidine pyrophosphatase-like HAD family hydrolase
MVDFEIQLRQFLQDSAFMSNGGVITDLDGTVVHEDGGRVQIPVPVAAALEELYNLGRPLILNTLRFPLSVMRVFGRDWYRMSKGPIPLVTLNGSQMGWIKASNEDLVFEEIAAFPLTHHEIGEILTGIEGMLASGVRELLLFYYPRDWRVGEVIWTPVPEKIPQIKEKYLSASAVTAVEFDKLHQQLLNEEICMIFLLINAPEDTLMAYQHTRRSNFFTRSGVDKLFGAQHIAGHIRLDLTHSIGAGDTEMDRFLQGVGLALIVGNQAVQFRGLLQTIRFKTVLELGAALLRLTEISREARP